MAVYKDGNKWRAVYRFTDWTGERKQTQKRGFNTKREAQSWEREQLRKARSDIDMTFESFVGLYREDIGARIKETTWETKDSIIDNKLIPYFGKKRISDIKPKDVIKWQNEMMNYRDENGKPYSPVYLKTLHNQLSTIFNHAVKFYGLSENPAAKAGNMGKAKNKEKEFWTKDEYMKFIDEMLDKPISFYAFEMLYWTGIRLGELLALTPSDFDFERKTVSIIKSYQRIRKKDIITSPKTEKSNRVINLAVLTLHSVYRNDPLLSEFAHINAVYEFSIADSFSERAFIQTPQSRCVTECQKSVKGRVNPFAVFPQFIAGQVKLIVPYNAVTSGINRNLGKFLRVFLKYLKSRNFIKQQLDIIQLCYAFRKLYAQFVIGQYKHIFNFMKHTDTSLLKR